MGRQVFQSLVLAASDAQGEEPASAVVQAVVVCTAAGAWAVTAAVGGGWVYEQMALRLEAFGCCHAA